MLGGSESLLEPYVGALCCDSPTTLLTTCTDARAWCVRALVVAVMNRAALQNARARKILQQALDHHSASDTMLSQSALASLERLFGIHYAAQRATASDSATPAGSEQRQPTSHTDPTTSAPPDALAAVIFGTNDFVN